MSWAQYDVTFDQEVRVRLNACTRGVAASANTPDYARILEFCDLINRDGSGRAAAITAQQLVTIMKEEQSYLILFLTLHVIELSTMNCGSRFHDLIANERFVKSLIGLGGKYLKKKEHFRIEDANSAKASDQIPGNQKALKFAVRMKAMALVQSLGIGFQNDARHSIFYVEYQKLVAKGMQFPVHKPTDFAPIATPAPHHGAPAPAPAVHRSAPAAPASSQGSATDNFTVIKNNVLLLNEMLRNNDSIQGNDLVQELVSGARTVRPQVQSWIANNTESPNLGFALEVNDLIESTLSLYSQRAAGGGRPAGGGGGPGIRIDEGKARNSLGSGGGNAGHPLRDTSSSDSSSSDDDFRLISNRHATPILQPISPSAANPASPQPLPHSQLSVQPMSPSVPATASVSPVASPPAPAPGAVPPAVPYPFVYGQPMYIQGPNGQPILVYPQPYYPPPNAAAQPPAPGGFASFLPANPNPSVNGAAPLPSPVASPAVAPSSPPAPAAAANPASPSPFILPASPPVATSSSSSSASAPPASNPFASPPLSPAHPSHASHPQPVPGAQPVYVIWPPAAGAAPPAVAAAPASASPAQSPFAPVPSPVAAWPASTAPAPQPAGAQPVSNPFK